MKQNRSRKVASVVAFVAIVGLLVTGTYAWYKGAAVLNEFKGNKTEKEVVLHDDFDADTGDKDVYVENTGDEPIYVRIQLKEAMDLTSNSKPADTAFTTHKIKSADDLIHDVDGDIHEYFNWVLGQNQKFYMNGEGVTSGFMQDITVYDGTEAGVKQTQPTSHISMENYLKLTSAERTAFVGWIFDGNDGYIYWSQALPAKTATGLLLEKVVTNPKLIGEKDYYYGLDVSMEAVDYSDLPMWMSGAASVVDETTPYQKASDDAQTLLSYFKDSAIKTIRVETNPSKINYNVGETFEPAGMVIEAVYESGAVVTLTASDYTIDAPTPLSDTDTFITLHYKGKSVKVSITVQ